MALIVSPARSPSQTPDASARSEPAVVGDAEISQELKNKTLLETAARIAGGSYSYTLSWLVIAFASGLVGQRPILVWATTACLGAFGVVRMLITRRLRTLLDTRPRLAHRALVFSVLLNGLAWGLLTAATVYAPEFESIRWAMLLVAVGLCSAGTVAMAIDPVLKLWFPMVLIGPVSVAIAFAHGQGNWLLAGLTVVYTIYAMHASRVVYQDYWRAMRAMSLLELRSKELERASLTDTLTQVSNRLHFDRHYVAEWGRACRQGSCLAVMVIDLDHFKRVNDSLGHVAGDRVLQRAASALRQSLMRPCDFIARYGGEEFVVLLPDTDPAGAAQMAERLRRSVAEETVEMEGRRVPVTCSIGYACAWPRRSDDPAAVIRWADDALYEAKAGGRDQVRASPQQQPSADDTIDRP